MRTNTFTIALSIVLAAAVPAVAQSGTSSKERRHEEALVALHAAQAARLHAEQVPQLHAAQAARLHAEQAARLHTEQAARLHAAEGRHLALQAALLAAEAGQVHDWHRLDDAGPPESWAPQDPADSLWRRARQQLNAGEYGNAARLFRQIRTESRFAQSVYRPDAFYWEAFALSRTGTAESLREAKAVLQALEQAYPPGERSPDAQALATRIEAGLAGHGSAAAARELQGRLATIAKAPVASAQAAEKLTVARMAAAEAAAVSGQNRATFENLTRAYGQATASALVSGQLATTMSRGQLSPFGLRSDPQCRNADEEIRLIALNALVEMEDATALPALREVLARRDECAPQMRRQAMMILARRASPQTETIALEAARKDPDPEVRQMALTWLVEKENAQALEIAQSMLATAPDRETRQVAIMALARSRSDRARQILRDFVRSDAQVELRGEALMALPLARGENATEAGFLRQVYGETRDRQMKEYALMALGRRALAENTDWLLAIAQDPDEDVELRTQAIWMLRADTALPVARVAAIYDQPGDRRPREAALMILAERSQKDAAALDKLIVIARDEKDVEFRRQAVMALSRSKEPRARAVLLEILRSR